MPATKRATTTKVSTAKKTGQGPKKSVVRRPETSKAGQTVRATTASSAVTVRIELAPAQLEQIVRAVATASPVGMQAGEVTVRFDGTPSLVTPSVSAGAPSMEGADERHPIASLESSLDSLRPVRVPPCDDADEPLMSGLLGDDEDDDPPLDTVRIGEREIPGDLRTKYRKLYREVLNDMRAEVRANEEIAAASLGLRDSDGDELGDSIMRMAETPRGRRRWLQGRSPSSLDERIQHELAEWSDYCAQNRAAHPNPA